MEKTTSLPASKIQLGLKETSSHCWQHHILSMKKTFRTSHSMTACPACYFYVLVGKNENWMLMIASSRYVSLFNLFKNTLKSSELSSDLKYPYFWQRSWSSRTNKLVQSFIFYFFNFHLNILCSFNLHAFGFSLKLAITHLLYFQICLNPPRVWGVNTQGVKKVQNT